MNHNFSRTIIETIVRKAISDIQDAPKLSIRNCVDMALTSAEGRFQNYFFQTARVMLEDESSSYYKLVSDTVVSVDTDKLVTFGLNLGYNSCTIGAQKIRRLEQEKHFNIPWSVTLAIHGSDYLQKEAEYNSILEQGKALGIYTWMIYALDEADKILSLVREHPECAFILYCNPEEITDTVLDEAENIDYVMFAVRHADGVENACRLLRSRRFLYSVFYLFGESDCDDILRGEFLSDTEILHPLFTGFLAKEKCAENVKKTVYQYIVDERKHQRNQTILWDIINDSCYIDGIVSEESCSAGFTADGYLATYNGGQKYETYNILKQPLSAILEASFPKS